MTRFISFTRNFWQSRSLIAKLAWNDFRVRYAGSYFGILWAFVQPVVTILVYWFVFSVGFRASTGDLGIPFVLYLVAGIIPWFFFQDALVGGTASLLEYNYLVKKVVFNISVLPAVKLVSALIVHAFFLFIAIVLFLLYGRGLSPYCLQLVYYCLCTACLALAVSYTTSAVTVLFRDLQQIVQIILQVGVWMTPIMWVAETSLAGHVLLARILKLNPMYYVVSGYRDSLIFHRWFWEKPMWTLYFWLLTGVLALFGGWIFGRLKVHFADVL